MPPAQMFRHVIAVLLLLVLPACGGAGDAGNAAVIDAVLRDDSIALGQSGVEAGIISFEISNQGTLTHELEVFAGELEDLPVSNGVADTAGLRIIDEVEDIPPGATLSLEVELDPGHYVILCNLPGHYQAGMVAQLDVSG